MRTCEFKFILNKNRAPFFQKVYSPIVKWKFPPTNLKNGETIFTGSATFIHSHLLSSTLIYFLLDNGRKFSCTVLCGRCRVRYLTAFYRALLKSYRKKSFEIMCGIWKSATSSLVFPFVAKVWIPIFYYIQLIFLLWSQKLVVTVNYCIFWCTKNRVDTSFFRL